jgi:transposase
LSAAWKVSRRNPDEAARLVFPPEVVIAVKSLACALPSELGLPLSRLSMAELQAEAVHRGLVASIGETTIWRWLSEDAIRPWYHRSWIFPRDPLFAQKAGAILDLYEGVWKGVPLKASDCVLSTDEKTSIQARQRLHASLPPEPGRALRVEHEYERRGSFAYLAAWDVRRAKLFGYCHQKTGIAPFEHLVGTVMAQEPYQSAPRVFWIMDNGSSHRGQSNVKRLQAKWKQIIPVYTPVHASWLNQIEIYFSIIQRKVLTPNTFESVEEGQERILQFQERYEQIAKPFRWKFTRRDLDRVLERIAQAEDRQRAAA